MTNRQGDIEVVVLSAETVEGINENEKARVGKRQEEVGTDELEGVEGRTN